MIVDINDAFTALTGFDRAGSNRTIKPDVNIWKNPSDRQKVVDELGKKGLCQDYEAVFRAEHLQPAHRRHKFAKLISLHGAPHIISVTRDIITERKQEEGILTFLAHEGGDRRARDSRIRWRSTWLQNSGADYVCIDRLGG